MSDVQSGVPIGSDQNAPAHPHADAGFLGNVETFIDRGVEAVSQTVDAMQPVSDLARAAVFANQQPASADPVQGSIALLEQRVVSIETALKPIEGVAEIIAPGSSGLIDRVAAIESTISKLAEFVEANTPLLERVLNAFNIHFGGKI